MGDFWVPVAKPGKLWGAGYGRKTLKTGFKNI
jgi:hypothetical protein